MWNEARLTALAEVKAIVEVDFGPQHSELKRLLGYGVSSGRDHWIDLFLAADSNWIAFDLAVEQGTFDQRGGPSTLQDAFELPALEILRTEPIDKPHAQALVALLAQLDTERRTLVMMALLFSAPDSVQNDLAALIKSNPGDWVALLALPSLPPARAGWRADVEMAREGKDAEGKRQLATITPATRALQDALGIDTHASGFAISIRCEDVSEQNPKKHHLRGQTSSIRVAIDTRHGKDFGDAWCVTLDRAVDEQARHGHEPLKWTGNIRNEYPDAGEAIGQLQQIVMSRIQKGRVVELRGTVDKIPSFITVIEQTTGRSFYREEAYITARESGELEDDDALVARVRTWLGRSR